MVRPLDSQDLQDYAAFDMRYQGAGVERAALSTLPVVDLAQFVKGTPRQRLAVAEQIRQACIDIGFFYLLGHGLSQSEIDLVHGMGLKFFALPLDEKMKTRTDNSSVRQGYIRTGGVNPDAAALDAADAKERFGMGREIFAGEPLQGRYSAGNSQWPDDTVLPGFEALMKSHLQKRVEIGQQLVQAFAMSLELPETYFDRAFRYPGCSLFFNFYSPLSPEARARNKWGFSPHTDYGAFTLLTQDALGGLQVRNAAGQWIEVPPLEGSLVVNIADMFAMWTNDVFTSSLHRAINLTDQPRISLAFFFHPNGMEMIECLHTCKTAGNPERYPPLRAEQHMRRMVEQMNLTGRPGISERTAERLAGS
ncbi:MAG: isopenicillin N synthase family dioxygenase [Burkholderiales bacterium]